VAGSLTVAVVTTIRRHGQVSWLRILSGVLVANCAVTLTSLPDGHGVGLLASILIGLMLRPDRGPSGGEMIWCIARRSRASRG